MRWLPDPAGGASAHPRPPSYTPLRRSAYFPFHSLSWHSCYPCLVHQKSKVIPWGTPSMIFHNEVDTHTYSPDTIHKEPAARPLSFHFTSVQTITEENDSKQRLAFVTWRCSDLEVLGYAHAFKTSVYHHQRCVNNNKPLREFPIGENIRNIIFSFFAVPPSQNYIFDHSKQLFFYKISSLNASFRRFSKLGYYLTINN